MRLRRDLRLHVVKPARKKLSECNLVSLLIGAAGYRGYKAGALNLRFALNAAGLSVEARLGVASGCPAARFQTRATTTSPSGSSSPSEYFRNQIYSCFFNDSVCGHNLEWWGQENIMWSNDFPHPNSTWPNSLKIIQRDLGHLPVEVQTKVLATNVCKLYNLDLSKVPTGIAKAALASQAVQASA